MARAPDEGGNIMAEVKFTEKELGFIDECTIDKQGNLTLSLIHI